MAERQTMRHVTRALEAVAIRHAAMERVHRDVLETVDRNARALGEQIREAKRDDNE